MEKVEQKEVCGKCRYFRGPHEEIERGYGMQVCRCALIGHLIHEQTRACRRYETRVKEA